MDQMVCVSCCRPFTVRPQSPAQTYCSAPECQRERRKLWNQHKLRDDPDYRANQRSAQQAWHARNPDYWRSYRQRRRQAGPNGLRGMTPATSDASSCGADNDAGLCWMEIRALGPDGYPVTWRVELSLRPPSYANTDACKQRT